MIAPECLEIRTTNPIMQALNSLESLLLDTLPDSGDGKHKYSRRIRGIRRRFARRASAVRTVEERSETIASSRSDMPVS